MMIKIIAEIGSTWKRDTPQASLQAALDSIRVAAECGADAVKFQMLGPDGPWSRERAFDQWERTRPYWLDPEWIPRLQTTCREHKVEFWLSLFDSGNVEYPISYCDGVKLASGELTPASSALIDHVIEAAEDMSIPIAFSTGTHTEEQVQWGLEQFDRVDVPVYMLNCVSKYPARSSDYSLLWPLKYRGRVGLGLSDHTLYNDLVHDAVIFGYTVFEKHFGLYDILADNPDIGHSLTPDVFKYYVKAIRQAEQDLFGIEKRLAPGEEHEAKWMQRGRDGRRPRDDLDS